MFSSPRRPLQDISNIQSNPQIRLVPYSPPRLSPDYSVALPPEQETGGSASTISRANVKGYGSDTPHPRPEASPTASSSILSPDYSSRNTAQDVGKRRSSTPRRPSTSSSTRRLKHVINVHADKTFSLLPQVEFGSTSICSSSFLDSTIVNSASGQDSSFTFSYGRRSSTLPVQHEDDFPASPQEQKTSCRLDLKSDASSSSPWNYEFVGGLRKVYQQTPKSDIQESFSPISPPQRTYSPMASIGKHVSLPTVRLIPRKPLPSARARSPGDSNEANYTLIRQARPITTIHHEPFSELHNISPSDQQNYCILGDSSSDYSHGSCSRPRTEDSEPNYIKHDGLSSPFSADAPDSKLKSEFSRESLTVPPLKTARTLFAKKTASGQPRQEGQSPKVLAAWSAVMNQDAARALFGSRLYPARHCNSITATQAEVPAVPTGAHQHLNQSRLSTMFSRKEGNVELPCCSMLPPAAESCSTRINSEFHSDKLQPVHHSLHRQPTLFSEPTNLPHPSLSKNNDRDIVPFNHRLVGVQDEHGDGLADLCDPLRHHSSRRVGYPEMIPGHASDRSLWSSASAKATIWAIPTWARLYYGGGERRFVMHQASRESIRSAVTDSLGGSLFLVRSPSIERSGSLAQTQPGNWRAAGGEPPFTSKRSCSDPIWARTLKKQTSSLWSPHLRRDKRASTYGIWDPPADALSVEGCITARRNVQVVLFLSGFLLPVAWMVAAFLPLPTNRGLIEKDFPSTSHLDLTEDDGASPSQLVKEIRLYNRAKWWRDLNRAMAIIGLLIIGAVVVLVAIGAPQRWH